MKYLFSLILFFLFAGQCFSQSASFDTLLSRGKADFKNVEKKDNYVEAINNLKQALTINSNSAEAHYFLGYAYSRFNSSDASSIPQMKLSVVKQCSAELEKAIALTPLYTGEMVSLDPYSKITSEWGAMALCYLANNKPDSAKWALIEGKKRGGFDAFILAINRAVLNNCTQNAILLSSGDNFTLPLFYLQTVERLRPDVSVADATMLNAHWYPRFLERTTTIRFGIKNAILDTLEYKEWAPTVVSIPISTQNKKFSWTVKPSDQEKYLLRGDLILISLLKTNAFKRDVFFTKGFGEDQQLCLKDHLLSYAIVDKLNPENTIQPTVDHYIADVKKVFLTLKPVNVNAQEELSVIDIVRYDIMCKIDKAKQSDPTGLIYKLIDVLKNTIPLKEYPCFDNDSKEYLKDLGIQ